MYGSWAIGDDQHPNVYMTNIRLVFADIVPIYLTFYESTSALRIVSTFGNLYWYHDDHHGVVFYCVYFLVFFMDVLFCRVGDWLLLIDGMEDCGDKIGYLCNFYVFNDGNPCRYYYYYRNYKPHFSQPLHTPTPPHHINPNKTPFNTISQL